MACTRNQAKLQVREVFGQVSWPQHALQDRVVHRNVLVPNMRHSAAQAVRCQASTQEAVVDQEFLEELNLVILTNSSPKVAGAPM